MKRVLFSAGLLATVGLGILIRLPPGVTVTVAALLFLAAALCLLSRKGFRTFAAAFCLLAVCVVFGSYALRAAADRAVQEVLTDTSSPVTATVVEEPIRYDGFSVYEIETDPFLSHGKSWSLRLSLLLNDCSLEAYDRFAATLRFSELDPDYRDFALADGRVLGADAVGSITYLGHAEGFHPYELAIRLRKTVRDRVKANLPPETAGILCGFLVGGTEEMDDATAGSFRESGLSHTVAVSGLHMTILVNTLVTLLCGLGLRWRTGFFLALPLLIAYAAMSGFTASSLRAVGMIAVVYSADLFRRRADRLNFLGGAALVMLAISPYRIFDRSFQLSFSAMAGILILTPRLDRLITARLRGENAFADFARSLLSTACATVSATAATFPILLFTYGGISTVSVIANLLTSFLVTVALPLGMLAVALGGISALFALSRAVFFVTDLLLWCIRGVAVSLASLPGHWLSLPVTATGIAVCAVFLFLSVLYFLRAGAERRFTAALPSCAMLLIAVLAAVNMF